MFDFANSSYTTVIITVLFGNLFAQLIVGEGSGEFRRGNLLWSTALSISHFLAAMALPVLGAIMDFSAAKKKFLFASYILTVITTSALFFVGPGDITLAVILIVASNFGFSIGEAFAASFLPDLATPESMGRVSGFAWGLGYFGGLLSTLIATAVADPVTVENFARVRLVGPITGAFYLVAAIPTFLFLREHGTPRLLPSGESYLSVGFQRLQTTVRDVRHFRDLASFLVSFFFASAGLINVVSFAFIFGAQVIRYSKTTEVLLFVLTQLSAAAGAFLFGFVQDRIGNKKTFGITLVIWVVSVTLIYATTGITGSLNQVLGTQWAAEHVFLALGGFAGLCMGATQSASRALVGTFSPSSKTGEFFAFWGVCNRLASIVGLMSLGILQALFGLNNAILVSAFFFLVAFVLLIPVNEARGRAAALAHEGE